MLKSGFDVDVSVSLSYGNLDTALAGRPDVNSCPELSAIASRSAEQWPAAAVPSAACYANLRVPRVALSECGGGAQGGASARASSGGEVVHAEATTAIRAKGQYSLMAP